MVTNQSKAKDVIKNKDINKGNVNDKVDTKLNASNSKDTEADKMKDQQTHIYNKTKLIVKKITYMIPSKKK